MRSDWERGGGGGARRRLALPGKGPTKPTHRWAESDEGRASGTRRRPTRGLLARRTLAVLLVGLVGSGSPLPGDVREAAAAQSGTWTVFATAPLARREAAAGLLNGTIYVVGGITGVADTIPTVEAYDVATDRWREVTPLPEALHHVAVAGLEDKLYVVGGFGGSFAQRAPVDSVWAYDPAADRWEPRARLPAPRGAAAVVVLDGLLYALGGERLGPGPGGYKSIDDAAAYDPRTDRWEILPPMQHARDHLFAGAIEGRIYAAGGRDLGILDLPLVEEYDPATRAWRDRAPMPTGRSGGAAAVLGGNLYVFGGEGNPASPRGVFSEVEAYDPATDTWAHLDYMPTPRHAMGAVALGDRIYLPGGNTRRGGLGPAQGVGLLDAYTPD